MAENEIYEWHFFTLRLWKGPWGLLNEEVHSDAIENQKTRNLPAQPIVMKAVSNTGHSSPFRCCWSEGLIIHPCHPSLIIHPSHPYLIFPWFFIPPTFLSTCTPSLSMHPLLPLSYHPPVLAPSYLISPIVLAPSPNWSGGRQRIVKGPGRSSGRSASPKGRSTEIPESSNEQSRSCKQ